MVTLGHSLRTGGCSIKQVKSIGNGKRLTKDIWESKLTGLGKLFRVWGEGMTQGWLCF